MSQLPMVIRPVRDSMLKAAENLLQALEHPGDLLPAVRESTLALENHLDTLASELHGEIEPRLLEQARELESRLRAALVDAWAIARDMNAGPVDVHRISGLSDAMRRAGSLEFDLVNEQLRDDGALD